ncbi:MAG: sulfide/dihydroorotate dehydrogenase-like FAD/NAD-binding protein [Candidatus Omnitrophota bacterium]|nr:sulfide/dihydroorotate dehydrogenase-like FAD/NAD-binding protein [Candidatus Omnitrophota bacterium]MDZ4243055.1 sulfide/dihydroorotate dehydrogenase-like FAD/NAD-binding protein [Candidatus Omnitrophota bacterium]
MFKIVNKQMLGSDVKRLDILAETIAVKAQPGQYVMVIPQEGGEWLPQTIVEADPRRKTISLIFPEAGPAAKQLGAMAINQNIYSIIGPLGRPSTVEKAGLVICVSSGAATAQILPVCRSLTKAGNKVIGVIGAKTRRALVLEAQMRLSCHKLYIATNDGSYERRGRATDIVRQLLDQEKIRLVYAVGSPEMMKAVCELTRSRRIKTLVQLSPAMPCGLGLCGACRVRVAGDVVLACEKGLEFNGHQVDFSYLAVRSGVPLKAEEEISLHPSGLRITVPEKKQ